MHVLCLGPMIIRTEEREVVVQPSIRSRLLVVLLANPGRTVSKERLMRELWPFERPEGAAGALQAHVSRLRRDLTHWFGPRVRVESKHLGYLMVVDDDVEVDLRRFEELATRTATLARHAPDRALVTARTALRLWRDDPFAGLDLGVQGQCVRVRLQETRLNLWEALLDAALTTGRTDQVIADARLLLLHFPFRERFHAQLMVALYRAGRQAEALEAYRRARTLAVDELGVEPSPMLENCMSAILRHDGGLDRAWPLGEGIHRQDPA
jgi:DNA-binding SARP family transcriptional activator